MSNRVLWLWLRFGLLLWGGHTVHAWRHLICQGRADACSQEPQSRDNHRCFAHPEFPFVGCQGSVSLARLMPSAVPGRYT